VRVLMKLLARDVPAFDIYNYYYDEDYFFPRSRCPGLGRVEIQGLEPERETRGMRR